VKSQVTSIFNDWLKFMERAYEQLNKKEFRELEDKIRKEISFHRKRKKKNVTG
jgi:hypothetical protein